MAGSSKQTTTVKVPPPTKEEMALVRQQLDLASQQLANLSKIGDFTSEQFQQFLPTLANQVNQFLPKEQQITADSLNFADKQINAQGDLLQSELDAIKNGFALTPEQSQLISSGADAAINAGLSDIGRFRDESIRALTQETSVARGLRPEDTPIIDQGGRIVNESQRLAQNLISQVRAQESQQKLDFPITVGNAQAQRTQAQQTLGASTSSFVQQLQQQAFQNRLNLTNLTGTLGLNLAGIGPNPNTLPSLTGARTAATTTTSKTSGGGLLDILKGVGAVAGGAGGLITGLSGAGLIGSSAAAAGGTGFTSSSGLGLSAANFFG